MKNGPPGGIAPLAGAPCTRARLDRLRPLHKRLPLSKSAIRTGFGRQPPVWKDLRVVSSRHNVRSYGLRNRKPARIPTTQMSLL
jgi:hypothetical protein